MKKTLLATLLLGTLGLSATPIASADVLKLDCGNKSSDIDYCEYIKERFEKESEHTLEFVTFPAASEEKLAVLQQLFSAKDSGAIDVFSADTIWMGILQKHMLDLTDYVKDLEPQFFPATWSNNVVDGRVYAVPSNLDSGMLYYRKDLLEKYNEPVPETWEDLQRIATKIQAEERKNNPNFWGFVFQGKSYEGLTCNALEWVASYKGGVFVETDGSISINNQQASKALDMAASWVGTIAPEGVLGYMEEEGRAVFQNGDALFHRNWPYAYMLSQDPSSSIKGKVGVTKLPKGGADGQSVNALGGWQHAVSAYSKNPEAAVQLVRLLNDEDAQRVRLKMAGQSPSLVSLYDDPEVLAIAPYLTEFKDIFLNATPRPSSQTKSQYARASNAIFNVAYDALRGNKTGDAAVTDLEARLQKIKGKEWK